MGDAIPRQVDLGCIRKVAEGLERYSAVQSLIDFAENPGSIPCTHMSANNHF